MTKYYCHHEGTCLVVSPVLDHACFLWNASAPVDLASLPPLPSLFRHREVQWSHMQLNRFISASLLPHVAICETLREHCGAARELGIQQLACLKHLSISDCPELVKWCKSRENRMKLAHIEKTVRALQSYPLLRFFSHNYSFSHLDKCGIYIPLLHILDLLSCSTNFIIPFFFPRQTRR